MPGSLVLIRGLPGSGKSTMARHRYPGHILVEADQFFYGAQGAYRFDRNRLADAHAWCQDRVAALLADNRAVVVANTFTQQWEIQPYRAMAARYGAQVTVIVATGNYPNIHGVSAATIERMRARWED